MKWKFCISFENCHVRAQSKYGFVERAEVSQILGHSTPEAMETGALWAWCGAAIQERPPRIQSAPADRARANGWGAWSPRPLFAILIWFGGKPKNHCGHLTRHTFMFDELALKLSPAALSAGPRHIQGRSDWVWLRCGRRRFKSQRRFHFRSAICPSLLDDLVSRVKNVV